MKQKKEKPEVGITYKSITQSEIHIGNMCFIVDAAFGKAEIDDIMADYAAGRINDKSTADNKFFTKD